MIHLRYFSDHSSEPSCTMHSAVVGLVREDEEGKRKGMGVLCLPVAGADWLCADVGSIGQVQSLLLFTSL